MSLQEIKTYLMRKDNFRVVLMFVDSLVFKHDRYEVKHFQCGLLVLIDLLMLNRNELVSLIIGEMKSTLSRNKMSDHQIVLVFK